MEYLAELFYGLFTDNTIKSKTYSSNDKNKLPNVLIEYLEENGIKYNPNMDWEYYFPTTYVM